MPKAPKVNERKALVLCKCETYCLKYDEGTNRFKGKGQHVPERTRTRHRRDDRLRRMIQSNSTFRPGEVVGSLSAQPTREISDSMWMDMVEGHLDVLEDIPPVDLDSPLEFHNSPVDFGPYRHQLRHSTQGLGINVGMYSLRPSSRANLAYLRIESKLWELQRLLETLDQDDRCSTLLDRAAAGLERLEALKETHWEAQRSPIHQSYPSVYYNESSFNRSKPGNPTVKAVALSCLVLQNMFATSRRALSVHLGGIRDILRTVPGASVGIVDKIPKDPRTLASMFRLEPNTATYVACPECHALYFLSTSDHHPKPPTLCEHKVTTQSPQCGAELWKKVDRGPWGHITVPRRKYIHQSLSSWLGTMLARPGIEDLMETRPHAPTSPEPLHEEIDDIWLSTEFRNLKDKNGRPYYPGPGNELRLVFSLSVDGFDPFGAKTGRQKAGSTGIWLVLLNLPRHLRYLQQNIYTAGIIPGPHKPSNDEINHYIQLLVNDFKPFWSTGVYFSRTFKHNKGRLARAIVIPLVCDMMAARQVIGYPGTTTAHYFCTACDLDSDDLHIIDTKLWLAKDDEHIRTCAALHREAATVGHQKSIFESFGWRWSPLLELEYWRPSRYTVIDSMHSLDLNLLKHHCRTILQIDIKNPSSDAARPVPKRPSTRVTSNPVEIRALNQCQEVIVSNEPDLLYKLLEFSRKVLYSFSLDYDIREPGIPVVLGTRWILAKNIYVWRQSTDNPSLGNFLSRYPQLSPIQEALLKERDVDAEDEPTPQPEPGLSSQARVEAGNSSTQAEGDAPGILPTPRILGQFADKLTDREARTDTFYKRITATVLQHFFDSLGLDKTKLDSGSQSATYKRRLWDHLLIEFTSNPDAADQLKALFPLEIDPSERSSAFLGKDVMENVWEDMKKTMLPSWVTAAPYDWGTTRRGNLSADNWRVVCCIHLVVTLVRLFGSSTGRKRDILTNFMDLVTAVRIATTQRSSRAQVEKYNFYISRYTEKVMELFPDYHVLPSHHAALHIGDMLGKFGPKHAHDSPHYERYIHFLHYQNTNQKLGELEATLLRVSARCANLRSLLDDDPETQRTVFHLLSRMKGVEQERLRGFRLSQMHAPRDEAEEDNDDERVHLTDADYELLCDRLRSSPEERNADVNPMGVYLKSISHQGTTYSIWNSPGYRDSAIAFRMYPRQSSEVQAGIIQRIFLHRHTDGVGTALSTYYLLVDSFVRKPLESDIYHQLGFAAGFSCNLKPEKTVLIALNDVISQVAVTEFVDLEMTHVLPINKASLSLTSIYTAPHHVYSSHDYRR